MVEGLIFLTACSFLQATISCPHEGDLCLSSARPVAYGSCEGEKVISGDCQAELHHSRRDSAFVGFVGGEEMSNWSWIGLRETLAVNKLW